MDLFDKRIMSELWANSRQSFRKLSSKIGLSASSVKKRIDKLYEAGFIAEFTVILNDSHSKAKRISTLVETDGTLSTQQLIEYLQSQPSIFVVLPCTSGIFFLNSLHLNLDESEELKSYLENIKGVSNVEMHWTGGADVIPESDIQFTKSEQQVLIQLLENARMPDYEVAKNANLSIKKTRNILDTLENDGRVIFTIKWNPAKASVIFLNIRLRYDRNTLNAEDIEAWLRNKYPLKYWHSHKSKNDSIIFSIFSVDHITEAEEIETEIENLDGVSGVITNVSNSAIVYDHLLRKELEDMIK